MSKLQLQSGYNNSNEVEKAVKGYVTNGIPLEAFWMDIDYMDKYYIFTVDKVRFPPSHIALLK